MSQVIKHQLRGGYSVTFITLSHGIVATVKQKNRKGNWTGFISGISHLAASLLSSAFIQRKLWINEKKMELKVCGGLQGAGSINSKFTKIRKSKGNIESNRKKYDKKINTKEKKLINSHINFFETPKNVNSDDEQLASSTQLKSLLGIYYKPNEWSSAPNYMPIFLLENHNYEACWRNFEILSMDDDNYGYFQSFDIKFLDCLKRNIKDKNYKNSTLDLAKFLRYIGCNYLNRRNYYHAKLNYKESHSLCLKLKNDQDADVKGKNNLFLAETLNNLGLYYCAKGKYRRAEINLEECLTIRKEFLKYHNPNIMQTFDNFCFLYESWGKFAKAEKFYFELLKINQEIHKFKPQELAPLYDRLGYIYINLLEYKKSEEYLYESLKLRKNDFSIIDQQEIATSHYWFGCLHRIKESLLRQKKILISVLKSEKDQQKLII